MNNNKSSIFVCGAISFCLVSCAVVTGLDPAEKLAEEIKANAEQLQKSEKQNLEFDFVPKESFLKKMPNYNGNVTLKVHLDKNLDREYLGRSIIQVENFYWTTHHNRFVWVAKSMGSSKKYGDPFRIVLRKLGNEIMWVEIN